MSVINTGLPPDQYDFYVASGTASVTYDEWKAQGLWLCGKLPPLLPANVVATINSGSFPAGTIATLDKDSDGTKDLGMSMTVPIGFSPAGCTKEAVDQMKKSPGLILMTDRGASFDGQSDLVGVRFVSTGRDLGDMSTPGPSAETSTPAASSPPTSRLPSTFANAGFMTAIRNKPTAILLPDGRVLVAGNEFGAQGQLSADIYDPKTGTFTRTAMNLGMSMETATLLADGRVLFIGGKEAALYDPATDAVSPTGSLSDDFVGHTATLLADGHVLVAGGWVTKNIVSVPVGVTSAEVYDPKTGRFTRTGSLTAVRESMVATLLADGRVLVAGFPSSGGPTSADLYNPKTGTFKTTGSMPENGFADAATRLPDGRVLFVGASGADLYDSKTGTFGAAWHQGRGQIATLLANGRVLIVSSPTRNVDPPELFDPNTGFFTPTEAIMDFSVDAAVALVDGQVLLVGGNSAKLWRPTPGQSG